MRIFSKLWFLVVVLVTSQCFAEDQIDSKLAKKEKKELEREMKRLKKEREQQERERKKEMRKFEREKKKEERHAACKENRKEKAREARRERKALRDEECRAKEIEKENKTQLKKEKKRLKKVRKTEEKRLACVKEKAKKAEKPREEDRKKAETCELMERWKALRKDIVAKEYHDGKYSGVYQLPSWPFSSWFFKEKAMFNVNASYWYATDAYDTNGACHDITSLDFGYKPICLKDILLASRLLDEKKVNLTGDQEPLGLFIASFGDKAITFNGKSERWGLDFDFARHVFRDDITIGVQVPVLHLKNYLDATMDFPAPIECYPGDDLGEKSFTELLSLTYKEELYHILKAKGIKELGGSAEGLGDVVLFGNAEITTKFIDKIVVGLKVGLPTGKGESMSKLWSPALWANGNCAEFAGFASFLVNYNSYINPHLFLQASFFSTGHVDKRIPHYVKSANAEPETTVGNALMAMGDRIKYAGDTYDNLINFQGLDSLIRGFADRPISVKYQKGPEFHIHVGNVFDKFICRSSFLDIYYDLRLKVKDEYRAGSEACCYDECEFDIKSMEKDTKAVEHRLGMEYSHQFDSRTRLKASMTYSVAGMNAPKAFDVGLLLGHSF